MPEIENWEDCPPGILTGMVEGLHHQHRPVPIRKPIAAAAVLVMVFAGYAVSSGRLSEPVNTLECGDVGPLLAQYDSGMLSNHTAREVEAHLYYCLGCRDALAHCSDAGQEAELFPNELPRQGWLPNESRAISLLFP